MTEICPYCYSELVSELKYPYKEKTYVSHYCVSCGKWVPKPKGAWSRWNPIRGQYKENEP